MVMCVDYRDDELNEENISEESTPLQDEETLTEPTDVTFDTRGVESDVVASRQVINLILNKKVVLIMGLGIFAFFFLLLFAFLVNNSSDGDDYLYKEASCKNVKVIYDPYGDASGSTTSMPIEDYVRVATYAYTSDFPDTYKSLLHVYYAVAVALRTEALSHNCEVTYRDKDLKNIQKSIKENDVIEYALKKASGIVLVDENEDFVKMRVADFCWTGDNSSHYSFPKLAKPLEASLSFVKDKIKSFILSDCECNKSSGVIEISEDEVDEDKCFTYWSEEETVTDSLGNQTVDVTWYKEYLHQDVEDAFQVYGAYYEFLEQGFNFEHIFSFFLKEKAYFRTINLKTIDSLISKTLSNGSRSSYCNTSSDGANFASFLFAWEGNEGYCDNEKKVYLAKKLKDNARFTIGVGVTEHVVNTAASKQLIDSNGWGSYFRKNSQGQYDLEPGDCVPVTIIDALKDSQIEAEYAAAVYTANEKYNANLTQYQIDALTDLSYNRGSNYVDAAVKAYVDGGYEGLWNELKDNLGSRSASDSNIKKAMQHRRKGEFALFVTGDYSDQGKFYDHRDLANYDYYDSEGVLSREAMCSMNVSESDYLFPLPTSTTVTCTSVYGYRSAPTKGATSNHQGLDLAASSGTPIYASRSGEVVVASDGIPGYDSSNSAGNWVKIKHDDGSFTAYMHMLNGSVKVKQGDYVSQGDQIGEVGSTGASTGNHLHFSVYEANGQSRDPYGYLDLSSVTNEASCKGNG